MGNYIKARKEHYIAQQRVQTPEFGKPHLQPAALLSDTFAASAQAPIERRFGNIFHST